MKRQLAMMAGLAAILLAAGGAMAQVSIETVPVGNLGNVADSTGHGAVGYAYNVGKHEVSNAEYAEFLNAVATVGDLDGLYDPNMASGWNDIGGISRTGSGSGGDPWVYSTRANRGNRPVNYVSFWDACRFANWLHNGQGSGDTETGAYTLTAGGITNNTVTRNPGWQWAVTSEDEWYKAAYHMNDGVTGNYWDNPTGSTTAPTSETPPGMDMTNGSANYYDGGYVDATYYYTTECGAYDARPSDSPYGTFDQGGNLWEWNESIIDVTDRGIRGGSFANTFDTLRAAFRHDFDASVEHTGIGFRVSEVIKAGDATLDGCVDGLDYVIWSGNYNTGTTWEQGDFTGEGDVDGLDYIVWSSNYQQGCPGTPGEVPEPASLLLLALGGLALLRRRSLRV